MAFSTVPGLPQLVLGSVFRHGTRSVASPSNSTIDATNESVMMIGRIWMNGGVLGVTQKTLDTSGSSSMGFRTGTSTFANAGTTLKVGLADVDMANGSPGRAVNVSDVITFDVSAAPVGGSGTITSAAWQEVVPTAGTKTLTHGDLVAFCVQATARAGADSITIAAAAVPISNTGTFPLVSTFTGSYANAGAVPNVVITFSDGTLGTIFGSYITNSNATTKTWNNTSSPKEYGNVFRVPAPIGVIGVSCANLNIGGDMDFVLYSDPFGTPVAERSVSIDSNIIGVAGASGVVFDLFGSVFPLKPNTDYVIAAKPTSASNVVMSFKTVNAAAHQAFDSLGVDSYAVSRDTGAFSSQNSSKDRFSVGVLGGEISNPAHSSYLMGI